MIHYNISKNSLFNTFKTSNLQLIFTSTTSINGSFVEESNFHISSVKMKIKIKGMEVVTVSDVIGEENEQ